MKRMTPGQKTTSNVSMRLANFEEGKISNMKSQTVCRCLQSGCDGNDKKLISEDLIIKDKVMAIF